MSRLLVGGRSCAVGVAVLFAALCNLLKGPIDGFAANNQINPTADGSNIEINE